MPRKKRTSKASIALFALMALATGSALLWQAFGPERGDIPREARDAR